MNETEKLEKIARMMNFGITAKELARILNVTEAELDSVLQSVEYKRVAADVESAQVEALDALNRSWDGVEDLALGQVIQHVANGADPEYALRVAMFANKAQRRNKHTNDPIVAKPNMQTVIHLQANFVQQLGSEFEVREREVVDLPQKGTNFLPASQVKSLLGITKTVQDDTLQSKISSELANLLVMS